MIAYQLKKLSLLPMLLIGACLQAQQSNASYPDFFHTTYPFMLTYDNPGYIVEDMRYNLYSQYKQRLGQFRKIVSYSALAERIWRPVGGNTHSLRIMAHNENEGPYIARPRAAAGYATEVPIREKWKLGFGAMIGATAINFSAPNQGATGNSYLPDGKLGIAAKKENLELGISALQFLNAKAKVVGSQITLRRYYNAFIKYSKELSFDWRLHGLALADLRGKTFSPQLAVLLEYRSILAIGASHRIGYTFSPILKLHMFADEVPLDLICMYNTPFLSGVAKEIQSIELALSLGIK